MSEKKKICILPNRLMLGGIEKVLLDGLQVLQNEYDIEIICFQDEQCAAVLDAIPKGVKVTYRMLPNQGISGFLAKIPYLSGPIFRKAMGAGQWDHLIVLRPSMLNAVFAGKVKHTVFWCHNDHHRGFLDKPLPIKKRIVKFFRRGVYRKYDMIWTVSEPVAQEVRDCFQLRNVYALPNPLDCHGVEGKAQQRCDISFDPAKINFIMIGRMSSEKGFQRVLKFMCRDVLPKYPKAQLYLIGNDTDDPRLKQRIKQLGMAERIGLLGPKGNPYPYLKQAQYLICPSVCESFGLVMLEAMLLGVRVITTDTVGGLYITKNNTCGCCVPNTDAALQAAVERYLQDQNVYTYNMDEARRWAYEHDIRRFGTSLLELLRNK